MATMQLKVGIPCIVLSRSLPSLKFSCDTWCGPVLPSIKPTCIANHVLPTLQSPSLRSFQMSDCTPYLPFELKSEVKPFLSDFQFHTDSLLGPRLYLSWTLTLSRRVVYHGWLCASRLLINCFSSRPLPKLVKLCPGSVSAISTNMLLFQRFVFVLVPCVSVMLTRVCGDQEKSMEAFMV